MRRRRSSMVALGLLLSVAVSVAAWWYFDTLFLFLFVPILPFLLRRGTEESSPIRTCPVCGFQARDPSYDYCPRDGSRLDRTE